MAVGDRIGAERTADIMRRANAIENDLKSFDASITTVGNILPTWAPDASIDNATAMVSGYDGFMYFSPLNHPEIGIAKVPTTPTTSSGSSVVASSTSKSSTTIHGASNLDVKDGVIAIALRNGEGARHTLRTYDTDGSKISDLYESPTDPLDFPYYTFGSIAILSDGTVAAGATKTLSGSSQRGVLLLPGETWIDLSADFSRTPHIWASSEGIYLVVHDSGASTRILRKYNNSMSLQKSVTTGELLFLGDNLFAGMIQDQTVMALIGGGQVGVTYWTLDLDFYTVQIAPIGGSGSNVIDPEGKWHYLGSGSGSVSILYITNGAATEFERYPNRGVTTGSVSLGSPDFGASIPETSSLNGNRYRPHTQEIIDIRAVIDGATPTVTQAGNEITGTTTSTSFSKLIDLGASFTSTVTVGDVTYSLTKLHGGQGYGTVSAIDSDTSLSLTGMGFEIGELYIIRDTYNTTDSSNDNLRKAAGLPSPYSWRPDDGDLSRIDDQIYSDIEAVLVVMETEGRV